MKKLTALLTALLMAFVMTGLTAIGVSAKSASDLADGTYTVDVALWHSSKDQASMAASCLKDKADLTVKNGKKTMTIHTQPMSMAGITASMQTMDVQQADGSYKAAKVVEKDADGNPTAFTFTVPEDDDEYIDVEVNPMVEMMGNQPMSARIKVDYSTATPAEAKEASPVEEAENAAADVISSASKLFGNDEDTDATSSASKTAEEPVAASATVNKDNLEDGTYTVGVQLWHAEKDQASMAASSLKPEAKIVVQNGNATMYIYTQPMTMGSITASLQELKVGQPDGSYKDAQVASRSSDGNPTSFRFALPSTDEYIPVQVNPHVEMMGNQFLDARIKVDWSSLKVAADASAEDPNGETTVTTATTSATVNSGAGNVSTGDESGSGFMGWYAIAIGAMTFALCFAVLKRGLV